MKRKLILPCFSLFFASFFVPLQTKIKQTMSIMFSLRHGSLFFRHLAIVLALMLLSCPSAAQKGKGLNVRQDLSQARSYLRSRSKNYGQAEQLMNKLLKDSACRENKHVHQVLLEAVKGQYDQANERMYLKQKQDTAAFFTLARRMFTIAFTLDSLDMRPDKKGRVSPEYRQKYAQMLHAYRPNLFNGGTFFVRKGKWQEAFDFMDTYLDCGRQPLFQTYDYGSTDPRMAEAAYWATYSAYKQQDAKRTLQHAQQALADTAHTDFTLQFMAEAHRWLDNKGSYVATLEEGFRHSPQFPYFFPRLMDAYMGSGDYTKALQLADSALLVCDTCELFLFAKSSVLLHQERWEESVRYSRLAMAQNDSLPEPYFNAALAYVNMADMPGVSDDKKKYTDYYQRARTYMEYYRLLMPKEEGKWAPVLYRIYLNLNLGKQFDEIDKILRKNK